VVLKKGGNLERNPPYDVLAEWDRRHVWHPFTQMAEYEPLFIERAEGNYLIDHEGKRYLDGVSSLWCNLHGHRHPKLDAALREQLDRVAHTTQLGLSNSTTTNLARRLVEVAPKGLEHVFFSDDGATAVEVALKMAFQYWRQRPNPRPEKKVFLTFGNAYHGDTLGAVSVGGVERFHAMFRPLLFDTITLPTPDTYRLPEGVSVDGALTSYLGRVEEALRRHHETIAALVIEPLVQAAAGMVTHPVGFLRGVRDLTRRYDVLVIADEVAVGFGRTGRLFACEHEDVMPDFLCLAKGLTAGYLPLAATLTTIEIWNAFLGEYAESKTFFHGHTYCGNPLGAAVALANLEIFDEEAALESLPPKIERLRARLGDLAGLPHVGDVRQRGLIAGIELVRDVRTKDPFPWSERRGQRVCDHAKQRGIMLRPLGNVIVVMPPLSVTLDEIDRLVEAIGEGLPLACAG
jgi:adenosylmethionine-8-amino-7-oxononanoate aminotransferase